ncbi:hypothetical protein D3C83_87400 [compost metagenome]
MTPGIFSWSTRSTVFTGWSFSGPKTSLIRTCISPEDSTSSKTIMPRASKTSLISLQTAGSASVSRVTPLIRAPNGSPSWRAVTVIAVIYCTPLAMTEMII